jgi:glucose-6-phosphate isomerase
MSAFDKIRQHSKEVAELNLRDLLNVPDRFTSLSLTVGEVLFDFSKHLVTPETMALLTDLAREKDVSGACERMFTGEKINNTEGRAVLHTALRAPKDTSVNVDGEDVMPYIHSVLERMRSFSAKVINGQHKGYTGKPITDIVNIGIGGSDLGPRFVVESLQDYKTSLTTHFVSNVDGAAITGVLARVNPETTLFIIASKTFTTEETMLNTTAAKNWFVEMTGSQEAVAKHFVALSTNEKDVAAFGINPDLMFPFRDWVGGRYSLWSAIGLSIMLSIGPSNFDRLLAGAHTMDTHFRETPLERNVPVIMGMLGVWYRNFWNYPAHLLLPYDDRLAKMAKFVQQMDMESNGKSVTRNGMPVTTETGPFIFGEPGTDSQHSFMQLVHQGTTPIPADFIICAEPHHQLADNHATLLSNCFAQSRALAIGQTLEEADGDALRVFPGNRPSTTIMLPSMSPFSLGLLLAAYEHKVFVQGIIWDLNSFDQPGVELGKKLAKSLKPAVQSGTPADNLDQSTNGLIRHLGGI